MAKKRQYHIKELGCLKKRSGKHCKRRTPPLGAWAYNLRFFRQLAKRAGISGSEPEKVADWLYNFLKDLQHGKVDG